MSMPYRANIAISGLTAPDFTPEQWAAIRERQAFQRAEAAAHEAAQEEAFRKLTENGAKPYKGGRTLTLIRSYESSEDATIYGLVRGKRLSSEVMAMIVEMARRLPIQHGEDWDDHEKAIAKGVRRSCEALGFTWVPVEIVDVPQ